MRFFWAILFLFFFFLKDLQAQNFSELSRSQILDFKENWRQLHVLGVPDGGLLKEQRFRLEDLFDYFSELNLGPSHLSEEFDYLFYFPVSLLELSQNFESHHSSRLPELYEVNQEQLRLQDPKFLDILQSLILQIQIREEMIRFPLFADSQFLAGLNSDDRKHFYRLQSISDRDQEIFESIADQKFLSQTDYTAAAKIFGISDESIESAYFDYLYLGRLDRRLSLDEAAFRNHFISTDRSLGLDRSDYSDQVDFYWQLYLASHRAQWRLSWEDLWIKSQEDTWKMSGHVWLENFMSNQWSGFQSASSLTAQEIFFQIKDYIELSESLTDRDRQRFNDSIFLMRTEGKLKNKDLPKAIRPLIAVALFPFLTLEDSFIFLDQKFRQLPLFEQERVLWRLPLSVGERIYWQERLHQISSLNTAELEKFEDDLCLRLLEIVDFEVESHDAPQVELLDGQIVSSSSQIRADMADWIEENRSQIDYGYHPQWLIDTLMIHLFPSQEYWSLEWQKSKNEWRRLNFIEEKSGIELTKEDFQRIQETLFDKNKQAKTDYSSPLVYLSSFAHGFVSDPARLIPALFLGSAFHLVFRSLGGKLVFSVLFGDAGLRIGSAYFFEDHSQSWYEVPVDQLIWTPGQLAAQEIQYLGRVSKSLVFPADASERLWAFRDLGQFSSEALSFGAGALSLELALPWSRMIHLRQMGQQHRHLEKFKRQRDQLLELEASAIKDLQRAELENWARRSLQPKERLKIWVERENAWHRLLRLEARWLSENRGLWGRLTQGAHFLARMGAKVYGLLPIKLPQVKRIKFELQNWKLRRSKSLLQLDRNIKTTQAKIEGLERTSLGDLLPRLKSEISKLETQSRKIDQKLLQLGDEMEILIDQVLLAQKSSKASSSRHILGRERNLSELSTQILKLLDESLSQIASLREASLPVEGYRHFWISVFDRAHSLTQGGSWRNQLQQTQLQSSIALQRLQVDSYLMLRDQWIQWQHFWTRYSHQRRGFLTDRTDSALATPESYSHLQSRFLTADQSMKDVLQKLHQSEAGLSRISSRSLFELDDYFKQIKNQQIISERAHLQTQGLSEFKNRGQKISNQDLPLELREFGAESQIWKHQDEGWIHYLIDSDHLAFVISGRNFAGRFKIFNRINVIR